MTYAALNFQSDLLARYLVAHGVGTEDFVAIYLDRSFDMIVGIFAILKAGGAYVPIDVNYPADRMRFMASDCGAKIVLTQSHLAHQLKGIQAKVICLDQPFSPFTETSDQALPVVKPENLAYMIYTSGSTGKPKGCMITHENILNQLEGQQEIAPVPIGAMVLTCSISFDVSVLTIFWPLLQGAPLVLPKQGEEKDMAQLAETVWRSQVTHMLTLPSPYTLLLEQADPGKLQSLRLVNVSGEVCPTSLAQKHERLLPNCQLYNLYGPTEAAVNCTFFTFPKGFSEAKVPIGIPIKNYEIFILDENGQEVPRGEVGEIFIGGTKPVVGRGYWNRPELTAERFVLPPPASSGAGKRYKTGDLGKWMPDGNIEFLGRTDFQVKYRGFRVELGEIETAVGHHPAVKETVVLLRNPQEINNQKLVAYATLNDGNSLTISVLRSYLETSLPEYMLPSHLVVLEKMPLTTNGKFDRNALPDPPNDRPELEQRYEKPQTWLEDWIVAQWQNLLQVAPIGRNDKFFELGGNSILAAKFIGSLMTACGSSIFITTIFDYPTAASYAAFFQKNYSNLLPAFQVKACNPVTGAADFGRPPGVVAKATEPSGHARLNQQLIEDFRTKIPAHLTRPIVAAPVSPIRPTAPVFIIAPPRSGTTLLRVMLAGHPGLFACNELQLLHFETLSERSAAYQGKFSLWSEGLVRAVMELRSCDANAAKDLLRQFEKQGMTTQEMFFQLQEWVGDRLIVDKSPSYALDPLALEKALADFPDARFIHLVRHPYSMVKSFEKYHMDQVLYLHPHGFSARQLGELVWLESHRNALAFLEKLPARQQFRMVYEDLVKNPEAVMHDMCRALSIPFHEGLLNPYQDLDKKMTDGIYHDSRSMGDTHFDQKKKIDAAKADDWRGAATDDFLSRETWSLSQQLGYQPLEPVTARPSQVVGASRHEPIAIIGMACRLPGADSVEAFWQNLLDGREVGRAITEADLKAEGVPEGRTATFVKRTYALSDPYAFDATFFGYHPKEAAMTDPQQRVFLETAYSALESAGYDPFRYEGRIGVFGGVARNTYFFNNLLTNKELQDAAGGWYQEMLATESSFSTTRVAYKLNLRGPAVNVQTACSTGGVAIHLACQSLLSGDADMVLVGGGRIQAPVLGGYDAPDGGPLSADGYCRAFDAGANGMVQGHGMAMLVLKKLDRAQADGDHIWAVIRSTAINNDGADKSGITAPSAKGQADAIRSAIQKAGLNPSDISYVETHGTGTFIGDPIEIQGLSLAMNDEAQLTEQVRPALKIGSVKTNIGHLDAGAAIVGVMKTALALHHEQLPATLHFRSLNPQAHLPGFPFEVVGERRAWKRGEAQRRAGVSSFGLGGTNAHLILEEAPQAPLQAVVPPGTAELLAFSAKNQQALERLEANFQQETTQLTTRRLSDIAYTLAVGRAAFSKRKAWVAEGLPGSRLTQKHVQTGESSYHGSGIAFLFPGGGAQYAGMASDLYRTIPFFRQTVDECSGILEQQHGLAILDLVFLGENHPPTDALEQPANALASLFTIEYSLAKLWMHWGIQPTALIGHSMGEYTAACLAGVMSLEAALGLVTVRGRLFEALDGDGCMLGVATTEEILRPFLTPGLAISVINKKDSLVVSGTASDIEALQSKLALAGVESSKIHIKVPAHSPLIEPILPQFGQYLETVQLHPPQIPIVSNVTGTWLTAAEATSTDYWIRHLRLPVRFADGLSTLLNTNDLYATASQLPDKKNRIFLEVGPGQTLSTFVRAMPTLPADERLVLASVRHPKEVQNDRVFLLKTLAKLWVNGVDVDWAAFHEGRGCQRVPLPTYPFERRKHFIAPSQKSPQNGEVAEPALAVQVLQTIEKQAVVSVETLVQNPISMKTTASRLPILVGEIKQSLHELSGLEPADMDTEASFLELGFDSLFLSQAVIKFNHQFGLDMSFRMLFEDAPTIQALAEFVDERLPAGQFAPPPTARQNGMPAPASGTVQIAQSIDFQQNENGTNPASQTVAPPVAQAIPAGVAAESSPVLQQIINQQLQLMQQQLALLGSGSPSAPTPQPVTAAVAPPPAASPMPAPAPEASAIQRSTKGVTAKLNSYKKIGGGGDLTPQQMLGLQAFMKKYAAMTQQSKTMAQRHREWYADPRSVTGFSKLWKEICYQIAHERSKGAKIWDVDGNEYVDYVMSYGVALFGHMPDFVEEAVTAALRRGNSIDLLPPEATEIARIICELTGFERVTLANTGTEAVLGAVRAARTATGRDKIAVFDTDYHGMVDQFMVRGVHFKGQNKTLPSSPGVPKFLVENTLVLDYDDPEVLQKLEANIQDLAAVVIEPVQAQNPHWQHPALIRAIRQLTEKHGVALIFDEIINGFRLAQRGAQAWYGVEADICAYGKSISGGLPLSAIAGKAKFMDAFDGGYWRFGDDSSPDGVIAYFASTFIKNPISVAAAYAALRQIEQLGPGLQSGLNETTAGFAARIREIFLRTKAPLMIQSCSSFFMIKNADNNPLTRLFNYVLRTKGVNIRERPCFLSTAHTTADFERTYRAFEEAIQEMFALGLMEPWEGEDLNVIVPVPGNASQLLENQQNKLAALPEKIPAEPIEVPTTEGQQEIFLSDQFSPDASKAYNIATEIRLEGAFDPEKMWAALQALVDRHEALRTVFSADGKTMRVLPKLEVAVPIVSLVGRPELLADLHHEEAEHLFDLQNGPLVRFKLVQLEELVHLVFINVHHIICDGWSLGILTRELGELYGGTPAPNLPLTRKLSDFAIEHADLQRVKDQGAEVENIFVKNENYWLGQFRDGVPVLELPTDFPRPAVKTFPGAVEKISFDAGFTAQVRKAAAKQGSTFYVFMLAAYQAYLSRITGQDDLVVGVAAAGHNLPGNANLVAHAINLLPLRTKLDGNAPFGDYLKTVRRQVLDAFDHQQFTFGALVKKLKIARNASRNTLVSVAFNLDSPLDELQFGGLQASTRAIPRHYETFDTFINLKPLGPTVDFEWNFNTDLFRRESIRLRLAEFELFLKNIVDSVFAASAVPIARLPLLPGAERLQLANFGQGEKANFPTERPLHELFAEQAARTPDKTAVQLESGNASSRLTYIGLEVRSNGLAKQLQTIGVRPGDFVGICVDRSLEMMIAIYGVLKAGAAYVPIDPRNPADRIKLILQDAGCSCCIVLSGEVPVAVSSEKMERFQGLDLLKISPPAVTPGVAAPFENAAYVIYTSGSTGRPKGVSISHQNAVNTLFAINKHLNISEKDTIYSVSSMSFDMSVPDYFLTLISGATLVLAGEETKKDGFALRESVEHCRPTFMQATPTTWRILLLSGWAGDPNLTAIAGGEGFPKDLAADLASRCKAVWNGYGPTETTIYTTYQRISPAHLAGCPGEFAAIGSPIANVQTLILDKNGEAVPLGVPGELYIGGPGVAAGYLNRAELTAEKFVNRPAAAGLIGMLGQKFYRTGDLVRYLPNGAIDFLGRLDDQVKIRGYRVELGEIEEWIKQFGGVEHAVVNVFTDNTASQRLVGYVVWEKGRSGDLDALKIHLRAKLPGYMVPSAFVVLENLPLNTSLKVDRKALPAPDLSQVVAGSYQPPVTPGERLLADLWKELLGVEKVGVNDDFFELGGHSLAAVQMMAKIKLETGVKLPLTALFQHSTVQKLAVQLNGFTHDRYQPIHVPQKSGNQEFISLIPIREGNGKPPIYLVHGGGLHVLFYQNLVKYLDADQPIFALQARGLDGTEAPLDRIEDMAAAYLAEIQVHNPDGPYCLAGYSLGGLIAWEMAAQLKSAGKEVPLLSLFDAVAKYEWAGEGHSGKWMKKLKKTGFNLGLVVKDPKAALGYKSNVLKMQFQHMKGKLRMAYRNTKTNEIEEGYLPYGKEVYEKSLVAYERYQLQPLDIQVDLFKAKEQMFYLHDPVHYGWDKFALRGVRVHEIAGNHLTLFDDPNGKAVADILKKRLTETILPVEI